MQPAGESTTMKKRRIPGESEPYKNEEMLDLMRNVGKMLHKANRNHSS
jgi:hypothetical protein